MRSRKQGKSNGKPNFGKDKVMDQIVNLDKKGTISQELSFNNLRSSLIDSVGMFGFERPIGTQFRMKGVESNYGTPALMTLHYTPTFGYSDVSTDAVTDAINKLYQRVKAANSNSVDYDPTDIGLYIFAVDQIYSFLEHVKRGLAFSKFSDPLNEMAPRQITEALGFDFDDIIRNQSRWIERVNSTYDSIRTLQVPKAATFAQRHFYLNSRIFRDDNSNVSQLYAFVPRTFFYLTETPDPQTPTIKTWALKEITAFRETDVPNSRELYGSNSIRPGLVSAILELVDDQNPPGDHNVGLPTIVVPKMTLAKFEAVIDQMVKPLKYNPDIQDMSSDIRKAYGLEDVVITSGLRVESGQLAELAKVEYSENMLMQIENATLIGLLDTDSTTLTENTTGQILLTCPRLKEYWDLEGRNGYSERNTFREGDRLISMHHDKPKSVDVVLATMFTNTVMNTRSALFPNEFHQYVVTARSEIVEFGLMHLLDYSSGVTYGTELVHSAPIFSWSPINVYIPAPGTGASPEDPLTIGHTEIENAIKRATGLQSLISWLASFNHHPIIFSGLTLMLENNTDDQPWTQSSSTPIIPLLNMEGWRVLNRSDIWDMSRAVLKGMFDV